MQWGGEGGLQSVPVSTYCCLSTLPQANALWESHLAHRLCVFSPPFKFFFLIFVESITDVPKPTMFRFYVAQWPRAMTWFSTYRA